MRDELRDLLRSDFDIFVAKTLMTVDPAATFIPNWHIYAIAQYLEAVRKGRIKRLIINMPPRSLKSVCVSVAWPAWLLGRNPAARIMVASYASSLSLKHSLDCRHVLQSGWYREVFPEVALLRDQNEKHKYLTGRRGFRMATSVGGAAMGEGGDVLIVDDPLNPMQAASRTQREGANEWFDHTFSTRLNHKDKGAIVIVMQRLHPDDLSGHLLKKGGWEHLCLPAVAVSDEKFTYADLPRLRKAGDLLHPARESAALIEQARRDLGSAGFAAQYQQAPLADEGAMIKRQWFSRYETAPQGEAVRMIQSWDTATKAGEENDRSVCITFAEQGGRHYVLDVDAGRYEYPQLRAKMQSMALRWKPHTVLIEDAASGQSILQEVRHLFPVVPQRPRHDKITRLAQVVAMIEAGQVVLPKEAPWLANFEAELVAFPDGKHDDQVDALTQYLLWVRQKTYDLLQIRCL